MLPRVFSPHPKTRNNGSDGPAFKFRSPIHSPFSGNCFILEKLRQKKTPQGLIALGEKWSFLGKKGSFWKSRKVLDGGGYSLMPQEGHHTADYVMISDRRRKDIGTRRSFPFPLWVQNQFPFAQHFHLNPLKQWFILNKLYKKRGHVQWVTQVADHPKIYFVSLQNAWSSNSIVFKIFIYLASWGLSCNPWDLHYVVPCCVMGSSVVAHGFSSCITWAR